MARKKRTKKSDNSWVIELFVILLFILLYAIFGGIVALIIAVTIVYFYIKNKKERKLFLRWNAEYAKNAFTLFFNLVLSLILSWIILEYVFNISIYGGTFAADWALPILAAVIFIILLAIRPKEIQFPREFRLKK